MKSTLTLAALTALSTAALGCSAAAAPDAASTPTVAEALHAQIAYAVDGDTLRVELADGNLAYVRLVGIDTPEDVRPGYPTECGSRAAASSMESLAPEGASVTLRPDSVADASDRYGRLLAHAFVNARQLEIAQLGRGWAEVYRYDGQHFDGLPRFEAAELSARRRGRGVWKSCDGNFHSAEG